MDVIRAYSNRHDLLHDLEQAISRLARATKEPGQRRSVVSSGRVGRKWSLQDRLSEDQIRGIVAGFRAGLTKKKLAEEFNISQSSVKRILRRHRIAVLMVGETIDA